MRTLEGGLTASILLVAVYAYTVNENFWVAGSLTLAAVARVLTYRGGSTRDSTGMIVSHRGASHALVAGCALGVGAYVRGNLEFMGTALTYLAGLFATCLIVGRWVSPGRKSKKQKRQRDQLFGVHGASQESRSHLSCRSASLPLLSKRSPSHIGITGQAK